MYIDVYMYVIRMLHWGFDKVKKKKKKEISYAHRREWTSTTAQILLLIFTGQ